jgi:MoaA/NifB/PqqE/SkfB family radical SAM enzyme
MKKPLPVIIEISGICNAKCPFCARQRFQERYVGNNMSSVQFGKIIDHLLDISLINSEQTIGLFNWGEPFLNTEINDILKILKKNNLFGSVSSNFIKAPKILNENLSILSSVTFSLSGFSNESYSKIHGANLNSVLDHFEEFYTKIRKYTPKTIIIISWHRYRFNESEFWDAYNYFDRPGIIFTPSVAFLNDGIEMISYVEGSLSRERKAVAEKNLFCDDITKMINYNASRSKNYHCYLKDMLVIDEMGQLLLCCIVTNEDKDYILGNILQMSVEDIWKNKMSDTKCNRCIQSGQPRWLESGMINHSKPIPFVLTGNYFKLSNKYLIISVIYKASKIISVIKEFPAGARFINWTKGILLSSSPPPEAS